VLNHLLLENFFLKSLICLITSYGLGFFGIKYFLCYLKGNQICRQPIRESGPDTHLKTKKNTPTMGGIFIVLATLLTTLLFLDLSNHYIWVIGFVFFAFSLIGLTDDLLKVVYKNTNGFRGSIKLVIQFAIIGIIFLWLGHIDPIHFKNKVFLPIGHGHWISLGLALFVLFVTFVIVGTSNAVNLTDGLDGLVSVPAVINLICLSALIFAASNPIIARDLFIPFVDNTKEIIFFCLALIGAILAFLTFNLKPAKIFMGDVGSLAIGSVFGLIAIIIKQEFIFFIISLLFVIEAVSVILQIASYKILKKRIFLMAPIHHHFEKLGWSEKTVVRRFWAASLGFAILGMTIFII
jgi:phospho-N-acetylmuramoyl-pentapeptide-transferase